MTNPSNHNTPTFILVRPQMAENIGMAARAMMNCGISQLFLVNPRESHLSDKAVSASSGAEKILQNARVFNTTQEAIAEFDFIYATTARRRGMVKPISTADYAAQEMLKNPQQKYGILFGPERTGLENQDVCLANSIIEIPLNPEHCSLNLSQAVLLVGYEWYQHYIKAPQQEFHIGQTSLASKEKLNIFLNTLEEKLKDSGIFSQPEKKERMSINLRNIFTRTVMTEQELNTLYGVINHLNISKTEKND